LGHVDGKKKSVPVPSIEADIMEKGGHAANEDQDAFKGKSRIQESEEERDKRRPHPISNLQAQGQESKRVITPIDERGIEINNEGLKAEVKQNPDGSICEGCS
jgi:hypothetical protein